MIHLAVSFAKTSRSAAVRRYSHRSGASGRLVASIGRAA